MSFDLKLESGDVIIEDGDFSIVEDSDKLVQDILKIISTPLGSNPFFPPYGSPITKVLIGTAMDSVFVEDIASQQLRSSLERLQQLQREQLKNNQIVSPDEQIAAIENVRVGQSADDPRYYIVNLTVINKAYQRIPVSFAVVSA